jgi:hypothetical protein
MKRAFGLGLGTLVFLILVMGMIACGGGGGGSGDGGLLTNGGFERGDLTGWLVAIMGIPSPAGDFYAIDATSMNDQMASLLPGSSEGDWFAFSTQSAAATAALIQSFTVPAEAASVILTYDMFILDQTGSGPINTGFLDHNAGTNQHARVDILSESATYFDTGSGVIRNLYLDVDGDTPVLPYISYSFDLTGDLTPGETYQLRFAFTETEGVINMGIDNVSVIVR